MNADAAREFDIAFLGAESVIHHRLRGGMLHWSVAGTPTTRENPYASDKFGDVEVVRFSKRASSGQAAHTFLLLDAAGGHALDATFLEGSPHPWHYDRGRIGSRVGPATAQSFPRAFDDPPASPGGRVFRLPGDMRLFALGHEPAVLLRDGAGRTVTLSRLRS